MRWIPVLATAAAALAIGLWRLAPAAGRPGHGQESPALAAAPGSAAGWNVLLVTLDTTRADHLGCYGSRTVRTPALDGLAAAGVRFENAVTAVPITLPAHATIMTGLVPPRHGVRDNTGHALPAACETLAERLQAAGYRTAAFVGAFVLDGRFGLAQGFETYDDAMEIDPRAGGRRETAERTGDRVAGAALEWLDEQLAARPDRPFFIWVHFFDPHVPYAPPEPFRSEYPGRPYAGEVAFMDGQIGRLLARLERDGLDRRTLVVAAGDHGEGLGDHGELEHGLLLYEPTVRVPLIVAAPGLLPAGRTVAAVAGSADLTPTVLDLLGLAPGDTDGRSLLELEPAGRAVYLESLAPRLRHGWSALRGLRLGPEKFIDSSRPELYDLAADPGEARDLAALRPERLAQLRAELGLWSRAEADPEIGRRALSQEETEQLASLGYAGEAPAAGAAGPLPDPRDMIGPWQERGQAISLILDEGKFEEGCVRIREHLARRPGDAVLWGVLALGELQAGRLPEATQAAGRAAELDPSAERLVLLAELQAAGGN